VLLFLFFPVGSNPRLYKEQTCSKQVQKSFLKDFRSLSYEDILWIDS